MNDFKELRWCQHIEDKYKHGGADAEAFLLAFPTVSEPVMRIRLFRQDMKGTFFSMSTVSTTASYLRKAYCGQYDLNC
ncbi:hypothetical protein DAI22_01g451432 [Oryza sativa Japonica Group]|nr:hypothetical protein DAI22_01g451432 [Oryza sativa Japonica Group]